MCIFDIKKKSIERSKSKKKNKNKKNGKLKNRRNKLSKFAIFAIYCKPKFVRVISFFDSMKGEEKERINRFFFFFAS